MKNKAYDIAAYQFSKDEPLVLLFYRVCGYPHVEDIGINGFSAQ